MIRVWRVSGEELAAISVEETSDVSELKKQLRKQNGIPLCMQQLLHNGSVLDDSTKLQPTMEVQLVLSSMSTTAQQKAAATELVDACEQCDVAVVRVLAEAIAGKDPQDQSFKEALVYGAQKGNVQIARLLLQAGAEKDMQSRAGRTALMYAALHNHPEFVQMLLETGANTDLQDSFGCTALQLAAAHGHADVVRLLLEAGANINAFILGFRF